MNKDMFLKISQIWRKAEKAMCGGTRGIFSYREEEGAVKWLKAGHRVILPSNSNLLNGL